MANPCYPPWFVAGQVSGWPRPHSPRIDNRHCRDKSNKTNFLAHTWGQIVGGPPRPFTGIAYTFPDGDNLFLFTYFADPSTVVDARLPHYTRFGPFDDIGTASRQGFTCESFSWSSFDDEWETDPDSRLFLFPGTLGWTERSVLEVDHAGVPNGSDYRPINDQEPAATFDAIVLPPFGPGGVFPWPPPDPPDFS